MLGAKFPPSQAGAPPQPLSQALLSQAQAQAQALAAQQQWTTMQAQTQAGLQAAQAFRPDPLVPLVRVQPRVTKARGKIERMVEVLPIRICAKILSIEFYDHIVPMRFVITFTNQRTLEFDDVEEFPSDAHVARIALECP